MNRHLGPEIAGVRALLSMALVLALCLGLEVAAEAGSMKADESVVLFPSFATRDGELWSAELRGWVYEHRHDRAALSLLERALRDKYRLTPADLDSREFRERSQMFLLDNEGGKRVSVTIGDQPVTLGPSTSRGHFANRVGLTSGSARAGDWIDVRTLPRAGDGRVFAGRIQLIGPQGISVVSDIDDTIKVSKVLDRRELALNTFSRPFEAVPGMAELYRRWSRAGDVAFHYVSGSPWQLYPFLADFLERERFPSGAFHLRPFSLKDRTARDFIQGSPFEHKRAVIAPLIDRFRGRRFVLVGDSGEQDPEVYAALAAAFPGQVVAILIRDVRGEDLASPRFVKGYEKLPSAVVRRVFRDAAELADVDVAAWAPR